MFRKETFSIRNYTISRKLIRHCYSLLIAFVIIFAVSYVNCAHAQTTDWVWAREFASINSETGTDIAVDERNGDVVLVGFFSGDLSASLGSNATPATTLSTSFGAFDGFVAKFDKNGNPKWAFKLGSPADDSISSVCIDSVGNIYIGGTFGIGSGQFKGTNSILGTTTVNNDSGTDAVLAKYDENGSLQWFTSSNGSINDVYGTSVCVSSDGVYMGGAYFGGIQFEGILHPDYEGGLDGYVVKYDTDGSLNWLNSLGGNRVDRVTGLAAIGTDLYVTGTFSGANLKFRDDNDDVVETFNKVNDGANDIFLAHYNSTGFFVWGNVIGGTGDDVSKGLAAGKNAIYLTGGISSTTSFPSYAGGNVISDYKKDLFISSHNNVNGDCTWVIKPSSTENADEIGIDVSSDVRGNVYVTGIFDTELSISGGSSLNKYTGKTIFALSLDSSGKELWAKEAGHAVMWGSKASRGIAASNSRETYVTGNYEVPTDFDGTILLDVSMKDIFMSKIIPACIQPDVDAGDGGEVCGLSYNMNATLSVGVGVWTKLSGPGVASFTDSTDPQARVSVNGYGTYTFNWKEYDGSCMEDSTITVVFNQSPIANSGTGGTACGLDFSLDAAYSVSGSSGSWSKISGPGNVVFTPSPTDPKAVVKVSQAGSYRFAWTETKGICSDQSEIDVSFLEKPIASVIDVKEVCDLQLALKALPSFGSGQWEMSFGAGNAAFTPDKTSAETSVIVDVFGDYTFKWTETNGTCSDDTSINVTFKLQPTANPGLGGDACDTIFQLGALLSSGSGVWTKKSGPGDVSFKPNSSFANAQAVVTEYGTYQYTWTETNGNCADDSSITVTYYEQPVADAGDGGDVCGRLFTLNAVPSLGAGEWQVLNGPGEVVFNPDMQNPKAEIEVRIYGTYRLRWTETNGSCSDSETIDVIFTEEPVPDAGSNGKSCSLSFGLSGRVNVGSGQWTKVSGPGDVTFSPSANNGNAEASVTEYGTYELKWLVQNGNCSNDSVISVEYNEQPDANAGDGGTSCGLAFQLSATLSSGVGQWELVSGPDTVAFLPDITDPNAVANVPVEGTYILKWKEINGECSDDEEIELVFYDQPLADPGSDDEVCGTIYALNAKSSIGSGKWSQTGGSGTAFFAPSNDNPNANVSVSEYGEYKFTWTETNGICSDDSSITIIFLEMPVSNPGLDLDVCGLDVTLGAILSSGTGEWSQVSGPSDMQFNGEENMQDARVSVSQFGDYVLRWTETNGLCSDDSTLSIRFMESIIADPGSIGKPCGLSYDFDAPLNGGTGIWTKVSGPGNVRFEPNANDSKAKMVTDVEGLYEINWAVTNGSCSDDTIFSIEFYRQPDAIVVLEDEICGLVVSADADLLFGSGQWHQLLGDGEMVFHPNNSEGDGEIEVTDYGNYSLEWKVSHGHCSDDTILDLNFIEMPLGDPGKGGEACGRSYELRAADGPGVGLWEKISGPGGVSFTPDASSENAEISVTEYGNYKIRWTESNGICQRDSLINLVFYEQFETGVLYDDSVCGNKALLLANESGSTGEWIKINGNGNALFEDKESLTTEVSVDASGKYTFGWTVGQSICKDTASQLLIFKPMANLQVDEDVVICEGSQIQLSASSDAPVLWEYDEQIADPSANQIIVAPMSSQSYFVSSRAENGCVDSAEIRVAVDEMPKADAGPDQELNYKFHTFLDASSPLAGTGRWEIVQSEGVIIDPEENTTEVRDLVIGENTFKWTVKNGVCPSISDEIVVLVNDLFIVNVLTPNGDGKNDYFVVSGLENMGPNELIIFNRWGNEVYRSVDYNNNWYGEDQQGNALPDDTYYYILKFEDHTSLKSYISIKR